MQVMRVDNLHFCEYTEDQEKLAETQEKGGKHGKRRSSENRFEVQERDH